MKNYQNTETNKKSASQASINIDAKEDARDYSYYSRVLKKPFDSIGELKKAEAVYYAELKAKEDKAAAKKADAQKVEEAFKALNTTRRVYKESLIKLTEQYSDDLKKLKETFEADKKELTDLLAQAEESYSVALKEFTSKYDSYHLSLKDGDFETTISGSQVANNIKADTSLFNLFDVLFNF